MALEIGTATLGSRRAQRSWTAAGYWAFGLAVFYAVFVRFSQAAGVRIGLPGTISPDTARGFAIASYQAGLLILAGGVVCLLLVRPDFRVFPRWLPVIGGATAPRGLVLGVAVIPALIGTAFAVSHGVEGIVTKGLELMGVISIHGSASLFTTVDRVAMDWWDVLFYEPWFLLIGVTAGLSTLAWAHDSGVRPATIRIAAIGVVVATAALSTYGVISIILGRILVIGA